ncbi:MAG TPA: hypothetical protein VHI10_10635 [Mycobacterium sp.]|nr:hypothetical protein [Mycobacterium sp.]
MSVAASAAMALVTVVTPGVGSAQCASGWAWDPATLRCAAPIRPARVQPPPPWYEPPPPWAPPWAPPGVPPPPPTPPWAPAGAPPVITPWGTPPDITPVWDPARRAWGIWLGPVWVPV